MLLVRTMEIRAARANDVERLREIERRAGELFRGIGMDRVADDEPAPGQILQTYVAEGRAFVAVTRGDVPAAYVLIDLVDGAAHVEQVSVDPVFGRRRVGAALLEQVARWATERGLRRVTLNTFDDVLWNRPYYARCGYRLLNAQEVTPGLARLRVREAELGLDAWPRVCMAREL